jgi:hypothetical protein
MRNNIRNLIIATLVVFVLCISINGSAAKIPTLEIKPINPVPESTLTFTAKVEDENTTEVRLTIQECNGNTGICFQKRNLSMNSIDTDFYEVSVDLEHNDATYIIYWIEVKTSERWNSYYKGEDGKGSQITLSEPVSDDDDDDITNNNGKDNNGSTPGFEFIGLFLSVIFILLILNKRKR